jgi:hypothetical protein
MFTDVSEKRNTCIFRTGEPKSADFSEDENLYNTTVITSNLTSLVNTAKTAECINSIPVFQLITTSSFLILLLYSYMFRPMNGHHPAHNTRSKRKVLRLRPRLLHKVRSWVFASKCKLYNKRCTVSIVPCMGIIQYTVNSTFSLSYKVQP